ncbi:lipopolysaccharide biosynthesis protein [Arsenicicoccus bolidensis]|uniref:lipopolysaccharide biosynthesis protein n=1 Tax=Arsenicicoccus bolidensis TaxID=229480 RepID=UPI0028ACD9CD|nr:lipopolysaccharide biosynthesis protein [Arsenicicoccus bolidensis]
MRLSAARRGLLSIIGGTAGGQVIALLCAPLISRLFPPAEYGPFAVVNAAVLPLATVAALRLDLAIPLPDEDGEALELATMGARIATLLGVILTAIAWWCRDWIAQILRLQIDPKLLVWIPIVAALMGGFTVLNQLAIRWRMYGAIGRRNILQAAVTSLAQVAMGVMGWGAHGLALGLALGQLAGVLSLWVSLRRCAPLSSAASPPQYAGLLRRYKSFPLLMAPSGLINALGLQAPLLMVAALYGATVSGWLGMTQRILSLPIALMGVALSQVYLGEFGAAKRSGTVDLRRLFFSASTRLGTVGLCSALMLTLLAPDLFAWVLGSEWRTSGEYARALAGASAIQMVASPLSQTVVVMGRFGWQALWDVGRLVLCVSAVVGGYFAGWPALLTIGGLGAAMAVSYAALWLLSRAAISDVGTRAHGHA